MTLKLHAADIPQLTLHNDYPLGFFTGEGYQERNAIIRHDLANGFYHEIFFEGIHISYGDIDLAKKTEILFESDLETVEMHFTLQGHTVTHPKGTRNPISFSSNQHNIIYANGIQGKMEWAEKKLRVFEINLLPDFFKRHIPKETSEFHDFSEEIRKRKQSLLNSQNRRITLEMSGIINEIIQCERVGSFKRMFLLAKTTELLLLQLEQFFYTGKPEVLLKKPDIDKMYAAKEFISANLTHPHSLLGLAKQVGTNEFTLKKGFKELFGTTVFGFWNGLKMEEAKRMLLEGEMPISAIADRIGYKNPQHFTTAFKKKFGIVPSRLRKG